MHSKMKSMKGVTGKQTKGESPWSDGQSMSPGTGLAGGAPQGSKPGKVCPQSGSYGVGMVKPG